MLQSALPLEVTYYMHRQRRSKYLKLTVAERLTSSQGVLLIDHGRRGSRVLFISQIVAFIHHAKQLMFSLCALRFLHAPW